MLDTPWWVVVVLCREEEEFRRLSFAPKVAISMCGVVNFLPFLNVKIWQK
jgi:hypothetical protein